MIDIKGPIKAAYYAALNGNVTVTLPVDGSTVIPVYTIAPDETSYPYILIADVSEIGEGEAMTKDSPYATDALVTLLIVTAFETSEDNESFTVADDIANEILQLVLTATKLTFTGLSHKYAALESSDYETERTESHLIVVRQLVIKHILDQ